MQNIRFSKVLAIVLWFFFVSGLNAQKEPPRTVVVQKDHDQEVLAELPFSVPFELRIDVKSDRKVRQKGSFYLLKDTSKLLPRDILRTLSQLLPSEFEVKESEIITNDKKAWFAQVPALFANRRYAFVFRYDIDDLLASRFLQLSWVMTQERKKSTTISTNKRQEFQGRFANIRSKTRSAYLATFRNRQPTNIMPFDIFKQFHQSQLDPHLKKIHAIYDDSNSGAIDDRKLLNSISEENLDLVVRELALINLESEPNDTSFDKAIILAEIFKKGLGKELIYGNIPLAFPLPLGKTDTIVDTYQRLKNLNGTISGLLQIRDAIKRLRFFNRHLTNLDDVYEAMQRELSRLDSARSSYEMVLKTIRSHENIFASKVFFGSTYPKTFKKYISNFVKANFGLMYFSGREDKLISNNFIGNIRPYVGLNLHPFAYDDDLPLTQRNILSRTYYQVGLSVSSIEVENVRTDLFGKSNIMMGAGTKLSNAIDLSYGVIFYNLLREGPLVAQKKTTTGFYISLGFHPDIQSIGNALAGLIFK